MRRASGRRRYNAVRQARAAERRVEVKRLLWEFGFFELGSNHGIRQKIADELGVHRSTISRDFHGLLASPRRKAPSRRRTSTAEWIQALEPLGAQLTVEECDCEETDELHHKMGMCCGWSPRPSTPRTMGSSSCPTRAGVVRRGARHFGSVATATKTGTRGRVPDGPSFGCPIANEVAVGPVSTASPSHPGRCQHPGPCSDLLSRVKRPSRRRV